MSLFQLSRCYIIYGMNYWAIAFPGLMYLASVCKCLNISTLSTNVTETAMGVTFIYQFSRLGILTPNCLTIAKFGTSFISISVALNLLLTLMIVVRLALHNRNIRKATGASVGTSGLIKTIITVLVESSALYAVNFPIVIRLFGATSVIQLIFWPILAETQVRATFMSFTIIF